ncbi:MAG: hypothetical protein VKJ24_11175 [Synechococcales bacterium]|nr:hypothetical protein [Synechococcales bacterium]
MKFSSLELYQEQAGFEKPASVNTVGHTESYAGGQTRLYLDSVTDQDKLTG